MSFRSNFTILSSNRELGVSRVLEAPPEQVFELWLRRLPEWWGPHGTTLPFFEIDPRPGGVFKTIMRAPDGAEYSTHGIFLEVVRPWRIVFTDAFESDWRPRAQAFFTNITCFDALPNGDTLCTVHALHWTASACEKHAQMGFIPVWSESLDRLAEVVAKYYSFSPTQL